MARDRAQLGDFLRARRDRISPARAGIAPFPGPRRVPGLRREELAVLAGLSADYYGRLEQGRQTGVSTEVLDALARALRLDATETAHLHDLAAPTSRHRARVEPSQRADPGLLRVMNALEHVPALLLGHRGEVLAANLLLREVLGRAFPPGTSFPRYLLSDPMAQERIVNWADFAPSSIAALRRESGRRPHDRALFALVEELRNASPEAATWWDDHAVREYASLTKRIRHPVAGELEFGIEHVSASHDPGQALVVYTVQAHSPTEANLALLRSWATTSAPQDVS